MNIKDMNVGIRQEAIEYLINSGFVNALCKKSLFPSDIDEYYDDYLQECYLSILELKDTVWEKLYNTAIEKGTDYFYQVRNYVSRVILNTCRSDSSNAYRKLKRHSITELRKNETQWKVYSNSIADPRTITEQIKDMDD
ncbi:MAG: hypothetical protein II453_00945 [Alphaproteobacteria bacterium]|nr:hypothetical protein [Alphaproteobacteria bacterium]